MGNRVPTEPQLGLIDSGQLSLLANARLASGSEGCFYWLLATGKPRIRVHHLLHLCKNKTRSDVIMKANIQ